MPAKQAVDETRLWSALLLLVNVLFQPMWFAVESFKPNLDSTLTVVTLVKLTYFLSVCFGFYVLAKIWPRSRSPLSKTAIISYRLAALVTVAALIAVHGSGIYHFAGLERELYRDFRAINRSAPIRVGEGLRLDRVQLGKRDVIYEYTMTNVQASRVDPGKVRDLLLSSASKTACSNQKLVSTLSQGIRLRYAYRDGSGRPLADFALDHDTCVGTPG